MYNPIADWPGGEANLSKALTLGSNSPTTPSYPPSPFDQKLFLASKLSAQSALLDRSSTESTPMPTLS